MHNTTFRTRLFFCFLGVILAAMLLPGVYVRQVIRQSGIDEATRAAKREALLIRSILEATPEAAAETPEAARANLVRLLSGLAPSLGLRVTYIDASGGVLAESSPRHRSPEALQSLDNHRDRVEFIQAMRGGEGSSIRYSETLKTDLVYVAVAVPPLRGLPSGVLRVAVPLEEVKVHIAGAMWQWFGILGVATLIALALAYALSSRLERSLREMIRVVEGIAAPREDKSLTRVHSRRRLHVLPGREFRTLASAVNDMADRIEEHLETIAAQKAQLETILDVMAEGVLVVGAQGRIRLVNRAFVRLFPLAEHSEGKKPVEVAPVAEIQQAIDDLLAAAPATADKPVQISLEVEARPETVLSVHLIRPRKPVHDVLAVAVFHDVSEMARLIRIRREFVANVSHELRTPLTAIIGYAETLASTLDDALKPEGAPGRCNFATEAGNCSRFAGTILRHARHMADMVNDLLQLSRIESGIVPMEIRETPVSAALCEALSACRRLLNEKQLTVNNRIEGDPVILADTRFLVQVFRNLLENACRYAPQGSAIDISAELTPSARGADVRESGRNAITFSVHDTGPGIPTEDLSRIFERFYRVEKHRGSGGVKDAAQATGLGLAISKHIVERHQGRIWAEDTEGATIRFTLPLAGQAEKREKE